ncbi:MAG: pyruvate kinase [Candidatus Brocadiales bacterium]
MRKTKIIATVGPACSSVGVLKRLILSGVDVFRINFSHGTHEEHAAVISNIRKIANKLRRHVAILQDLQGPKIRIGNLAGGNPITVAKREILTLTSRDVLGGGGFIPTNYASLAKDVKRGNKILIDDGRIQLRVLRIHGKDVECRVVNGGKISEHKGINLIGSKISTPAITPKDKRDLSFGLMHKVDFVALSFVRSPQDVTTLRGLIKRAGADIPVIAKIEKSEAVRHLKKVLMVSDGIMVARGDLGVEVSPEKVPVLQKRIIEEANRVGKTVITATQMLESMIRNPHPTRAEVSDVANAIFDGTDALMLSGETAIGKYPNAAVKMMDKISRQAEVGSHWQQPSAEKTYDKGLFAEAVAHAAYHASLESHAKAIVVFTMSGATAQLISKLRPTVPIVAMSPDDTVCRRLSVLWGVRPLKMRIGKNTDEMISIGERIILEKKLLKRGDVIIIIAGSTPMRGATNMMKLHKLGSASF